jgi:hypothetical protein
MEDNLMKIIKHTNYSEEIAKEKLLEFNGNYEQIIKDYYGINIVKPKKLSVNQEIYRQIRKKIDITDYHNNNPIDIEKVKQRFDEEDALKRQNQI